MARSPAGNRLRRARGARVARSRPRRDSRSVRPPDRDRRGLDGTPGVRSRGGGHEPAGVCVRRATGDDRGARIVDVRDGVHRRRLRCVVRPRSQSTGHRRPSEPRGHPAERARRGRARDGQHRLDFPVRARRPASAAIGPLAAPPSGRRHSSGARVESRASRKSRRWAARCSRCSWSSRRTASARAVWPTATLRPRCAPRSRRVRPTTHPRWPRSGSRSRAARRFRRAPHRQSGKSAMSISPTTCRRGSPTFAASNRRSEASSWLAVTPTCALSSNVSRRCSTSNACAFRPASSW